MALDDEISKIIENLANMSKRPEFVSECKKWEAENREIQMRGLMRSCGIPEGYSDAGFGNFTVEPSNRKGFNACKQYVENWEKIKPGESLALFGSVGTGKTHLAIVTCRELIKRYLVFAKYMPVLKMFEMARRSFDNEMANPIPAIKECDFLVLDDLGSERPTSWVLEQLTSIIDHRVANRLPFLITSNAKSWVGLCQMLTQLSDGDDQVKLSVQRIVDRLVQVIGKPIVMVGSSWRSKRIEGSARIR